LTQERSFAFEAHADHREDELALGRDRRLIKDGEL